MSQSEDNKTDQVEEPRSDDDSVEQAEVQTDQQDAEATEAAAPTTPEEIAATVEAILFSTDAPITPAKILQVAELSSKKDVTAAIETLNARYEESGSAFRIETIAGGYRLQTLAAHHQVLSRLFKAKSESKLSQPAMETLSIVAYRQPVLRADIEAIRGVACGEVLRKLMEKMLIKIVGRAEVIGRPMLYGTTRRFLEVFGLASLNDLPRADELREKPQAKAPTPPPADDAVEESQDAGTPDEAPAEQPEAPQDEAPAQEEPKAEAVSE